MKINHDEAIQAAKRLLGERFDPSLSLAALGDMCGHAFFQGELPDDACDEDIDLMFRVLVETEAPPIPERRPLFRGDRTLPDFLEPI